MRTLWVLCIGMGMVACEDKPSDPSGFVGVDTSDAPTDIDGGTQDSAAVDSAAVDSAAVDSAAVDSAAVDSAEPAPEDSGPIGEDTGALDEDGDGFSVLEGDCDDADPSVHPDADEVCDDLDNDCDALIDDADPSVDALSFTSWYADADGDGFGAEEYSWRACEAPEGYVAESPEGFDCDDLDDGFHPGAEESCEDEADRNCDGSVSFEDADGDGWAACVECNDADATIHPDADEVCDDLDNDCDGLIDDADSTLDPDSRTGWYADVDGDLYGDIEDVTYSCEAPEGRVPEDPSGFDCDDGDDRFHPGATESDCTDPLDYNCDGSVAYADADSDGWAACTECNDGDFFVHPDAEEVCDGIDNDCDDLVDDADDGLDLSTTTDWFIDSDEDGYGDSASSAAACEAPAGMVDNADDCDDSDADMSPETLWYIDYDGDGYGSESFTTRSCLPGLGWVVSATDCDDFASGVHPGAPEVCDVADVDEDCDGFADDADVGGAEGKDMAYPDEDGDGYGDTSSVGSAYCEVPEGMVPDATDCDDGRSDVNPGAPEVCDLVDTDEDCDGLADDEDEDGAEEKSIGYPDADEDGFGDAAAPGVSYCDLPDELVTESSDCDDSRSDVNPDANEVCDSADVDEDCDGFADDDDVGGADGKTLRYRDADGDGYGDSLDAGTDYCDLPEGMKDEATDCDDSRSDVNPGAPEVCDLSETDEDCDGVADDGDEGGAEGKSVFYPDVDADGYGDAAHEGIEYCHLPDGMFAEATDCDDSRGDVNPGAAEICDSADVDEDCDGFADDDDVEGADGKITAYPDGDGDGYGDAEDSGTAYCDVPSSWATDVTDCDDSRSDVFPGATETCSDGVDNDCDDSVDEDCSCVPHGTRRNFDSITGDTASGCWNGNVCSRSSYSWASVGQSFKGFGEQISCTGPTACVQHVAVTTYDSTSTCQGKWAVLCDGVSVGHLNTIGKSCTGSAMSNPCRLTFSPKECSMITLRAVEDGDSHAGCCGGSQPDTMITAVSVW